METLRFCQFCNETFSLPRRRKFCSAACKIKKHNIQAQIKLNESPFRKQILKERLLKRRIKNGILIDLPIRKVSSKGSGYIAKSGYKFIHKKEHPNANKQGSLAEHVFVLSEYLGRPLKKHETVHHKNGIRSDNTLENLELWSKGQPSGQRVQDKIKWAKRFLEDYGYLVFYEEDQKAVNRYYGL